MRFAQAEDCWYQRCLARRSISTGKLEQSPRNEDRPVGEGLSPPTARSKPYHHHPELLGDPGHTLQLQTPTCSVDTSTGPLSCPTRKNSTATVLFSERREAPERWVKSGKARARAQAEAKTSDCSQTICSTAGEGQGLRATARPASHIT